MDELFDDLSENDVHFNTTGRSQRNDYYRPVQSAFHDFHNRHVLWSLICPTPDFSQQPRKPVNRLHQFLNNLSWLGHYETGGDTVTSIAIEDVYGRPLYWVATNEGNILQILGHLNSVMNKLSKVHTMTLSERLKVQDEILSDSLNFSKKRVRNYRDRLSDRLQTAMDKGDHLSDSFMSDLSEDWFLRSKIFADACNLAGQYVQRPDFRHFKRACRHPASHFWIHHYLERLNSWHKAAELLVAIAVAKPELVHQFKLAAVDNIQGLTPRRIVSSLEDLLKSIWPRSDAVSITRELDMIRVGEEKDLAGEFVDRLEKSSAKIRPHAECIIAEHFHSLSLKFFNDDRYIGCSKPSCYSCDKYLQVHPGKFATRPTHGNPWANWSIPITDTTDDSVQGRHALDTLHAMIDAVESDIKKQREQKRQFIGKSPDSKAGTMSTIMASTR